MKITNQEKNFCKKKNNNLIKLQIKKKETSFNSQEISKLYSEIKREIIKNYNNLKTKPFYQIERNKIKFNVIFDPDRIEFWKKYETNKWENEITKKIEKYVSKDIYFVDIGAWIGPISLFAKHYAKKVISFEPDPIAYIELKQNIELNLKNENDSNVILNELAVVSDKTEKINLYSKKFGDSGSSIIIKNNLNQTQVNTINFIDMISKYNLIEKKIFLKIDIEGYEYELLKKYKDYLKRINVTLFFSLHPIYIIEKKFGKNNNRILQIIFFCIIYFQVFYKLPFKYILINNKKLSLLKLVLKCFLYGIPQEIHVFCTNKLLK